jgi:hypothetical protein
MGKYLSKKRKTKKPPVAGDELFKNCIPVECSKDEISGYTATENDQIIIKKATEKNTEVIGLDDEIQFMCNRSGRCCFGRKIPLSPLDIWKMINNDIVRKMGFFSSTSLLSSRNPHGIVTWTIDGNSGVPIGYLLFHRLLPNDKESISKCPMAVPVAQLRGKEEYISLMNEIRNDGTKVYERFWRDKENLPFFKCALGDDRPTICKIYPLGKTEISIGNDNPNDIESWKFLFKKDLCLKCFPESFLSKKITLRDYLSNNGLIERFNDLVLWNQFCEWLLNARPTLDILWSAGELVFDFDLPGIKRKVHVSKLAEFRPKSFKDLLDVVKATVQGYRKRILFT